MILHGVLLACALMIVGRLIELQVVKGQEYHDQAQDQQYGGVVLSAKRGEILGKSSKTGEASIFATNTTLDLAYVDPLIIPRDHALIADELAEILVTKEFDNLCRAGRSECPKELVPFYVAAFDPMADFTKTEISFGSGSSVLFLTGSTVNPRSPIPDLTEIKRQFARRVEDKIRKRTVTFVPLLYSATKTQVAQVEKLAIRGIYINYTDRLIYGNPDEVDQSRLTAVSRQLSLVLKMDPAIIKTRLLQRPLRYVPVMNRLPAELSRKIKELKERYAETARTEAQKRSPDKKVNYYEIDDPFRAVALIPEHWRYYPDTTIGSHVVGFINTLGEPQYGVERAYESLLRGQEGLIASVSDPFGGQIISSEQKFVDPRDGATVVLTIDRFVQNYVEKALAAMVKNVDAESGQVIVMDPWTGRIIALANAPLFDSNLYATVYEKEPFWLPPEEEAKIVVEIFSPLDNSRVLKAYITDITPEGRKGLTEETQQNLIDLERDWDLEDITRYYLYIGENNRREIFPTEEKGVWLKYKNNIGVGSYVNRTVQELYEPGSVMKPITMAVALDQGEVTPLDIYHDTGAVKVDVFTIKNALNKYYGRVTMVDCLDFSINTCMTSVSLKLGRKLFHSALDRFGFGRVTGIELDSELPGELRPWREWSEALVMTTAYGQGITVTPLQMVTAFSALANGGKLMKPTIIDEVRYEDGTVDEKLPVVVDQVIKPETSETITSILAHGAEVGFAKAGKVPGYRIAGKTGTSQIAGPGGKYETGTGSTIASYAGYAPIEKPKFVILVKLDRPRKDDFGSLSAAPLFKDIAAFLFEYYGIPPDEQ